MAASVIMHIIVPIGLTSITIDTTNTADTTDRN